MKKLMPKKGAAKIVVHRETLRELASIELVRAIGGLPQLLDETNACPAVDFASAGVQS